MSFSKTSNISIVFEGKLTRACFLQIALETILLLIQTTVTEVCHMYFRFDCNIHVNVPYTMFAQSQYLYVDHRLCLSCDKPKSLKAELKQTDYEVSTSEYTPEKKFSKTIKITTG